MSLRPLRGAYLIHPVLLVVADFNEETAMIDSENIVDFYWDPV